MRNKFRFIAIIVFIGLCLSYLYTQIVVSNSQSKFEAARSRFYLKGDRMGINFELPQNAYFLKIEHKFQEGQKEEIIFNGNKVTTNTATFHQTKPKGTSWIHLPREIVKEGRNTIQIFFEHNSPSYVDIYLSNFRTQKNNKIYILFKDSLQLPAGLIIPGLDYRVVVTPDFFWRVIVVILSIFFIIVLFIKSKKMDNLLSKAADFLFIETKFDIRKALFFSLLIIIVNLWVYWPSFSHPFLFDEWYVFFSTRHAVPSLQYIINRLDLQIVLPGEHFMFRPIAAALILFNRVIFDTNYVGPHIETFILHIVATICLWYLMWICSRRWISSLFALLFSVLAVSTFPVIWPSINGYIITTIFTLLAMITFRKTVYNEILAFKGFILTGLLLFLNSLSIETTILMPLVFFLSYWTIFRNRNGTTLKQKDRYSWLMLVPMLLWATFYSMHLYFVRFYLGMTVQSNSINLMKIFINAGRAISLLFSGIIFPMFIEIFIKDKIRFKIFDFSVVMLIGIILSFILLSRKVFIEKVKKIFFPIILIYSILIIIYFGRPLEISRTLAKNMMSGHYAYSPSALIIFAIYSFFDFNKILSNKSRIFVFAFILVLIVNHIFLTYQTSINIQTEMKHLKKYFDSVTKFVQIHKNEPDFSFKTIDRPPEIKIFHWFEGTSIDGLFNRFINNKNPKYLVEYDYVSENLKYSLYRSDYQLLESPMVSFKILSKADYINSIGVSFKNVSGQRYDFLMGMFEINQKQWKDVMGYNPSQFKGDDHPVENVSYYMVQEFIKRLNEAEGRNTYRLPIVQEYLFLINSGIDYMQSSQFAWFKDNSDGTTHLLGSLNPLPEGFYDVIGNVWEWTSEPIGLPLSIRYSEDAPRICFGGSWRDSNLSPYNLSTDNLKTNYPLDFQHGHLGFRLVKEIKKESN